MTLVRWIPVIVGWALCWTPALATDRPDGNRLAYLAEFCDPYYVGPGTPKISTPQWVGESGVEAVVILSIDDVDDPARYEPLLRPIIERLKRIEGHAPLSLMETSVDTDDPRVKSWLAEGVSVESHTYNHICPCLRERNFVAGQASFQQGVDEIIKSSGGRAVAYRTPCCDGMNSVSPRFFAELFSRPTPHGNFLRVDSSIFVLLKEVQLEATEPERFSKYFSPGFVNFIRDYPYPYVIGRLCWEFPVAVPSDYQGKRLAGAQNPATLQDMKASLDATVRHQGTFTLLCHPFGWISSGQLLDFIDYAAQTYGRRIRFVTFREAHDRLTKNMLGGHPLRAADGGDNGVRVLDLNADGWMDVVVGNEHLRQTRIWSVQTGRWRTADFPVNIVSVDEEGIRRGTGVQFGILRANELASLLVNSAEGAGMWDFDGDAWRRVPGGLDGLDPDGCPSTSIRGRDRGVRLVDLDGNGVCEAVFANEKQNAVFQWEGADRGWGRLRFGLPSGTAIVDGKGQDAGCRLVDLDGDGCLDVVFSDGKQFSLHLLTSIDRGWTRKISAGRRGEAGEIPMIVRADGGNNGAWFCGRTMWVQNEETGGILPADVDCRSFDALLAPAVLPGPRNGGAWFCVAVVLAGYAVGALLGYPLLARLPLLRTVAVWGCSAVAVAALASSFRNAAIGSRGPVLTASLLGAMIGVWHCRHRLSHRPVALPAPLTPPVAATGELGPKSTPS